MSTTSIIIVIAIVWYLCSCSSNEINGIYRRINELEEEINTLTMKLHELEVD